MRAGGGGNDGERGVGRGWQRGWADQLEEKQRPTRSASTSGWRAAGGSDAGVPCAQVEETPSSVLPGALCATVGTRPARVKRPTDTQRKRRKMRRRLPPVPGRGHPGRKGGRGAPLRAFGQNPKVPSIGVWFQLSEPFSCVGYTSVPSRQTEKSLRANQWEPGRPPTLTFTGGNNKF